MAPPSPTPHNNRIDTQLLGAQKSGGCEGEGKGSARSAAVDKATEPSGAGTQ